MQRLLASVILPAFLPGAAGAAIEGVVSTAGGTPIEHARVEILGGEEATFTGRLGRFQFESVQPPTTLVISHPRFSPLTVEVEVGESLPLSLTLQPKQEVYEEIAVTAAPGEENFSPVSVATSVIEADELAAPPATLMEMAVAAPAVSENGQGGIFQTYSIRGISRQRVMTLISGMRIVGERRAGVSASFLDPRLMQSVDVLRGPSSTFYGSGALGGVIQVFPLRFESWTLEGGYLSQGDENYQVVGWGDGDWSLGIARRDAGDSKAPDGETLFTRFSQVSGILSRHWSAGKLSYEVEAVASQGRDIGKSNTDYPERTTTYPDERHLLVKFAVRDAGKWFLEAWTHPNSLDTEVDEPEAFSTVENTAFDFGLNWQRQVDVAGTVSTRFGLDYFGRRNVDALEAAEDRTSGEASVQETLDNGEDNEAGLYGAMEWTVGRALVLAGARLAYQSQKNASEATTSDSALTGFAGLVLPLGAGFELVSNLGTGLRFPSLSERYFSGTTGRGEVVGNPDLDPERSLNLDLGLRWYGEKLFLSGFVSRNDIRDYIERIEIEPDLLTFVNLESGTIEGFELEGFYQLDEHWRLQFSGHVFDGRNDADDPLADIPPARAALGAAWQRDAWGAEVRWEERARISDPGPGEKEIPAASLLSAAVRYSLGNGLALSLSGRNLLDELYFNSADRRVTYSPGRAIGLALQWQG